MIHTHAHTAANGRLPRRQCLQARQSQPTHVHVLMTAYLPDVIARKNIERRAIKSARLYWQTRR